MAGESSEFLVSVKKTTPYAPQTLSGVVGGTLRERSAIASVRATLGWSRFTSETTMGRRIAMQIRNLFIILMLRRLASIPPLEGIRHSQKNTEKRKMMVDTQKMPPYIVIRHVVMRAVAGASGSKGRSRKSPIFFLGDGHLECS